MLKDVCTSHLIAITLKMCYPCSSVCTNLILFDLILYAPSTIFQLNRDGSFWVEPVLSQYKCVLLKDHDAVTPVRLSTNLNNYNAVLYVVRALKL